MMGYDTMKPLFEYPTMAKMVRNIIMILGLDNEKIHASKRTEGN
jgi:hypothetical protein